MKIIKKSIGIVLLLLSFTSCQKVIEIEPDSKDPQIVIEAEITDDSLVPQTVRITTTVNLDESNNFPNLSGATVTISDNFGETTVFNEVSAGLYQSSILKGISGHTYSLTVVLGGKTYTSVSSMPAKVPLDIVLITKDDHDNISITPEFHDPIGRGNYYRMKLETNSITSRTIFLFNDELIDGDINNRSLMTLGEDPLEKGDVVKVTMMCIEKPVYSYFFSLSQNGIGPGSTATPANPITNIKGETLGYFSAHTTEEKVVVIP